MIFIQEAAPRLSEGKMSPEQLARSRSFRTKPSLGKQCETVPLAARGKPVQFAGWFVAGPGTTILTIAGLRTGTGTLRRTVTTITGSGLPGNLRCTLSLFYPLCLFNFILKCEKGKGTGQSRMGFRRKPTIFFLKNQAFRCCKYLSQPPAILPTSLMRSLMSFILREE